MGRGLGSGENGSFTFLDILAMVSFCVGLQNLDINLTQDDIAKATQEIDAKVNEKLSNMLDEIHMHLTIQDEKLDILIANMESNNDQDKENS